MHNTGQETRRKFFALYLRQRRIQIGVFLLFCAIFLAAFLLYHLPLGAVLYPTFLCVLAGLLILFWDVRRAYQKHRQLLVLRNVSAALMESLPAADT